MSKLDAIARAALEAPKGKLLEASGFVSPAGGWQVTEAGHAEAIRRRVERHRREVVKARRVYWLDVRGA
jgi:hypothetical protein